MKGKCRMLQFNRYSGLSLIRTPLLPNNSILTRACREVSFGERQPHMQSQYLSRICVLSKGVLWERDHCIECEGHIPIHIKSKNKAGQCNCIHFYIHDTMPCTYWVKARHHWEILGKKTTHELTYLITYFVDQITPLSSLSGSWLYGSECVASKLTILLYIYVLLTNA